MDTKHNLNITPRDRVLRAWENSMELVRAYESYSQEITSDSNAANVFAEFAEDECTHASKLLEMLHSYENPAR